MHPVDRLGRPAVEAGLPVAGPGSTAAPAATGHGSFADALAAAASDRDVHLSGHALRRLEQRGIDLGGPELDRLSGAFDQLAGKGGRQSLVMVDRLAFVVHVPSKTVVTAVGPDDRKDSVFTRIDSVVIA